MSGSRYRYLDHEMPRGAEGEKAQGSARGAPAQTPAAPRHREPGRGPHEAAWEKARDAYGASKARLVRSLVRTSTDDGLRLLGLNINRLSRTLLLTLIDARQYNEPVMHLFRVPGIGLFESEGWTGTWYLRPMVKERLEKAHASAERAERFRRMAKGRAS